MSAEQKANGIDLLTEALRKGKVSVKFTKKDGTITERVFTLNPGLIAEAGYKYKTEEGKARPANPGILSLFQIDETTKAWKSLVRANLISFRPLEDKLPA